MDHFCTLLSVEMDVMSLVYVAAAHVPFEKFLTSASLDFPPCHPTCTEVDAAIEASLLLEEGVEDASELQQNGPPAAAGISPDGHPGVASVRGRLSSLAERASH